MPESGKPSLLSTAGLGTARCCVVNEKCSSMASHVDGAVWRGCGTFWWWNLGEEVSFKDVYLAASPACYLSVSHAW